MIRGAFNLLLTYTQDFFLFARQLMDCFPCVIKAAAVFAFGLFVLIGIFRMVKG